MAKMTKRGRPPASVLVGRMDRLLQELTARPVETMPDQEYVASRAQAWDALFAQERTTGEIVDFLAERAPDLGRARLTAMVEAAAKQARAKTGISTLPRAPSAPSDDEDGYDSFGLLGPTEGAIG